jgi:hypothetical protein
VPTGRQKFALKTHARLETEMTRYLSDVPSSRLLQLPNRLRILWRLPAHEMFAKWTQMTFPSERLRLNI